MLVAQLCLTLCDPMDGSPPGSSGHGILQGRMLEWVALSYSRGYCSPRDWTLVSLTAGSFFTIWVTILAGIINYIWGWTLILPMLPYEVVFINPQPQFPKPNGQSSNNDLPDFCSQWSRIFSISLSVSLVGTSSFPGGSDGKAYACNAGDLGLVFGSGRSSGEGNGNPF